MGLCIGIATSITCSAWKVHSNSRGVMRHPLGVMSLHSVTNILAYSLRASVSAFMCAPWRSTFAVCCWKSECNASILALCNLEKKSGIGRWPSHPFTQLMARMGNGTSQSSSSWGSSAVTSAIAAHMTQKNRATGRECDAEWCTCWRKSRPKRSTVRGIYK